MKILREEITYPRNLTIEVLTADEERALCDFIVGLINGKDEKKALDKAEAEQEKKAIAETMVVEEPEKVPSEPETAPTNSGTEAESGEDDFSQEELKDLGGFRDLEQDKASPPSMFEIRHAVKEAIGSGARTIGEALEKIYGIKPKANCKLYARINKEFVQQVKNV